jgi:hypothetical protein
MKFTEEKLEQTLQNDKNIGYGKIVIFDKLKI